MPQWKNKLYYGDNLDILRNHLKDESVDLIYLDPPFNSQATYNVLFREQTGEQSTAQITAFDDTWHWGHDSEVLYHQTIQTTDNKRLADLLQAFRSFLGTSDMMAYLTMMAPRLAELHRVLKPTGSIYLHCDPTASHYIKLLLDAIFGQKQFQNEIVWYYRGGGVAKGRFGRRHDIIFFYTNGGGWTFNVDEVRTPYSAESLERLKYKARAFRGEHVYDTYEANPLGKHPDDVWELQPIMPSAKERLGYPTQKPEALLERIIKASSNEGDIILDPFCGCGTATAVAERLHRRWIGIDITHLAISLIRHRLNDTFKTDLAPYEVIGDPKDITGARELAANDRYQFEWWALGLVDARPAQDKKKGADSGVDGYIYFFDDESGKAKKILVQVKSGHPSVTHIRDLKGVLQREDAAIGVYVTLEEPTRPMRTEAASAGFYEPEHFNGNYPRVQILTIAELLAGKTVQYPRVAPAATFKRAAHKEKENGASQMLLI